MVESMFSNLFIASDKSPEDSTCRVTLQVRPEKNNSYPWCEDRVFIKGCFSATIEGAMMSAAKRKGCHLDDVKFIYQLMTPNVKGIMFDANESPEEWLMNIVNVDITNMVGLTLDVTDGDHTRSVKLRPFAMAIPRYITDEFTDVPCVHGNFSNGKPSDIYSTQVPVFTVEIKPFSKHIYEKCLSYENDKSCHRPEFIEFRFETDNE